MAEQENIVIPLEEKSLSVLVGLIEKYKLQETDEQALEKVKEHKPFNENIVIQLTRDLMLEKISNNDFLDNLHKELKTSKEETKNLAIDIIHELVPLLEKIPEDQLEERNRKEISDREDEELKKAIEEEKKQEVLLQKTDDAKAAAKVEAGPPKPFVKKVETKNVEENAKKMDKNLTTEKEKVVSAPQQEEITKVKTVLPQDEKKGPDDYREPIE